MIADEPVVFLIMCCDITALRNQRNKSLCHRARDMQAEYIRAGSRRGILHPFDNRV